jgi:hypothetical protein
MISINEMGIRSASSPNAYFNKISLSYGSKRSPKVDNSFDRSNTPEESKTKSGDKTYRPGPTSPSYASSSPIQVDLEVYIQDTSSGGGNLSRLRIGGSDRNPTNLVIFQSTNAELTNEIIENNLFDFSSLPILSNYNRYIDYQILETTVVSENNTQDQVYLIYNDTTQNEIETLIKNFNFNIPKEPSHLTYFVFSKIVIPGGTSSSSRVIHSPVSIERVIENSSVVKRAFLFKDQSGNIWPGPVHLHPTNGWMQGAYHTQTPHEALQKQTVNNFKVGDGRILKTLEQLQIDIKPPTTPDGVKYFDIFLSKKSDGSAASIISFDIKRFLISNSKFGGLINTSSQIIQKDILNRSKILSFEVVRNKIKAYEGENKIGSVSEVLVRTKKEAPVVIIESSDGVGRIQPKSKYLIETLDENKVIVQNLSDEAPNGYDFVGSIEEVSIQNANTSRTFSVTDVGLSRITDGKYQYEVRVTLNDGASEYLSETLTEIRSSLYGMRNYFNLASMPSNFDMKANKFTTSFIKQTNQNNGAKIEVWLGSIINYIKTLDLLTFLDSSKKEDLNRELYYMVSPITGTLDGIEYFIQLLENLENKLSTLISKQKSAHLEDKSSDYQTRGSQYLSIQRSFSEYVDASRMKNTGFDYIGLNKNDNGILKLTQRELSDRIGIELNRISNDLYSVDELKSQFNFISEEEANALYSRQTNFSYIAPAYVDIYGYKTNLLQSNISLDYASVTAAIQNIANNPASLSSLLLENSNIFNLLSQQGSGISESRLADLNSLYAQNAISTGFIFESSNGNTLDESGHNMISSAGYLGTDNLFTNSNREIEQQDLTVALPDELPQDTLSLLDRILETENINNSGSPLSSTPLVDVSFDLTKNNNFLNITMRRGASLDGIQNTDKALSNKINELPAQIKLLALRKNRLYDEEDSILSTNDDSKTDGFIYNFGMIRTLEYWDGRLWKQLSEQVISSATSFLLCRIRKINNAAIKVGYFKLMDSLPVYDEHFLLSSSFLVSQTPPSPTPSRINSLNMDGLSYDRSGFVDSAERSYFSQLTTFESQRKELFNQAEYTVTEPPLAPTNNRGRQPGVPNGRAATMLSAASRPRSIEGSTNIRTASGPSITTGGGYGGGY